MRNIYDSIFKEKSLLKKNGELDKFKLDVLGKLGYLAFTNTVSPDTLPDEFILDEVWISPEDLGKIFKHLGLHLSARVTFKNLTNHQMTYIIAKKKKKAS